MKILGLDETTFGLKRTGERTNRRQLRVMREYSIKIRDEARELAPVDEGNLEEAIEVLGEDRLGTRRNVILIGVNESKLGEGYTKYGYRYDVRLHEFPFELGPLSQQKAMSNGKAVGSKYLERALDAFSDEVGAALAGVAQEEAGR